MQPQHGELGECDGQHGGLQADHVESGVNAGRAEVSNSWASGPNSCCATATAFAMLSRAVVAARSADRREPRSGGDSRPCI
jgi:hypothetical protein